MVEIFGKSANNFSVVSLPRRLFEPYTPTKTSIVYFEKAGKRKTTHFYVVNNVGYTFGARKKITTKNDLPKMLDAYQNQDFTNTTFDWHIEDNTTIERKKSLWIYDYIEKNPHTTNYLDYLGNHIRSSGLRFKPHDTPDEVYTVLGISNTDGVFVNSESTGDKLRQSYIRVSEGDIVYNPHRVNVGSIGVVPKKYNGGIVSGIYIVFTLDNPSELPPSYLVTLLKSRTYLDIIRAYDTKYGAVRANLNYEQLCKIKVVIPTIDMLEKYNLFQDKTLKLNKLIEDIEKEKTKYIDAILS